MRLTRFILNFRIRCIGWCLFFLCFICFCGKLELTLYKINIMKQTNLEQHVAQEMYKNSDLSVLLFSAKAIENQVKETEERGEMFKQYMEKYKGQNIYNEIALAIEFGYQMCLTENK